MRRNLLVLGILFAVGLLVQAKPAWISQGEPDVPLGNGPSGQAWFKGDWQFHSNSGLSVQQLQSGSGNGWNNTTVPAAWNQGDFSSASMSGKVGWYRVVLPELDSQDRFWFMRFDGIAGRSQFWLNGKQIAASEAPYLPVTLQLSDLKAGGNVLVVKVDNRRDALQLPPAKPGKTAGQSFGDGWWNWGGIVRGVRLWSVRHTQISRGSVETVLSGGKALLTVKTLLTNPGKQTQIVSVSANLDGVDLGSRNVQLAAGQSMEASWRTSVSNPHLWSPKDPHLVPLEITASNNTSIDRWSAKTGLREVQVRSGHLFLNGQPLKVWGVNLHEHTSQGWASSLAEQDQLLDQSVSLGGNLIRSHYPLSDYILERADQLGLMVWDEIPVWQPTPATMASSLFRARALEAFRQTILRDRIHPGVITWSVGNEYQLKNHSPGLEEWVAQAKSAADGLDPTRPLSVAAQPPQLGFAAWKPLGLIGVNSYVGWYYSSMSSLPRFLKTWRNQTPRNQAMVVSEFGAEATTSGTATAHGSFAYQDQLLGNAIKTISSSRDWDGGMIWVLRDFACRPGWTGKNALDPNPPFNNKGLFTAGGQAKPSQRTVAGWYRRILKPGT